MQEISSNIEWLKKKLPPGVKLVAVSKNKPPEDVIAAYNTGQRCFGENRVQELLRKKDLLPSDIGWHLIGHLQSNKVKYIAPFISMIQSVDSLKLLRTINEEALKNDRIIDCLLQVHIAEEETKFGFGMDELKDVLSGEDTGKYSNARICGLMGMSTLTDDMEKVRQEFRSLFNVFTSLKTDIFVSNEYFKEISMGMSGDYETAIDEGSTMIRIGSLIFGER